MTVLLPYFVLSALFSAATCVIAPWTVPCRLLLFLPLAAAYFIALLVLSVLFAAAASLFVDKRKPQLSRSGFYRWMIHKAMGLLCALCGVKLSLSGEEKLPEGRFLLVCNHLSAFDPIVTGWALREYQLAFISKPENMRIPVVGRIVHKGCFLAIDRDNDREALKTIIQAIDLIRRDVVSIAVYPEGTRSTDGQLLPFRNGAFKIAQKAKVPVVVAVIKGSEKVRKNMFLRPTPVNLEIKQVLSPEHIGGITTAELGDEVREIMLG